MAKNVTSLQLQRVVNIRKQSPNLMNLTRVKNPPKPIKIKRRLKSWNIEYNFNWNQPYSSRVSNLNRGPNSLNSASDSVAQSSLSMKSHPLSRVYLGIKTWKETVLISNWKKDVPLLNRLNIKNNFASIESLVLWAVLTSCVYIPPINCSTIYSMGVRFIFLVHISC